MSAKADLTREKRKGERELGFTLIEVLIALVLFSIGILGIIALQGRAVDFTTQSENSTRAAILASDLAAQMQTLQTLAPSSTVISEWQSRVTSDPNLSLPNSSSSVAAPTLDASGNSIYTTITIRWKDPSKKATDSSDVYQMVVTQ